MEVTAVPICLWIIPLKRENLILRHRCDDQYLRNLYPNTDTNTLPPQRFFDVMLKPPTNMDESNSVDIWNLWACDQCKITHNSCDNNRHYCGYMGQGCALEPKPILENLRTKVENILHARYNISERPVVKIVGPAVNFCLKYPSTAVEHNMLTTKQISKDGKSIIISVDLTLAIEIEKTDSEDWLLQGMCGACGGLQPTDEIKTLCERYGLEVKSCHLVAKGGYWNVSFANVEGEIMQGLHDQQRSCLRAIKV